MTTNPIHTIIFDLGNVLIRWNPRLLYYKVFDTQEKADWFVENIVTLDWNEEQDRGRPVAEATEVLVQKHPEWEREIRMYYDRWTEHFPGAIEENVALLEALAQAEGKRPDGQQEKRMEDHRDASLSPSLLQSLDLSPPHSSIPSPKYRLLALTNWSAELFPWARATYPFLDIFEDIMVSGEVRMKKPDPEIYELLRERYDLGDFSGCVFIDDSERNCVAARKLGLDSIRFVTPEGLREELRERDVEF